MDIHRRGLTTVGSLTGNTGSGTFNRSDGCAGTRIAVKRQPSGDLSPVPSLRDRIADAVPDLVLERNQRWRR